MADPVEEVLRQLLADALGVTPAAVAQLPADADLFAGPLPLGSLAGAWLLAAVADRFGVDVAAEDLSLDCLGSIAALRDFVAARFVAARFVAARCQTAGGPQPGG